MFLTLFHQPWGFGAKKNRRRPSGQALWMYATCLCRWLLSAPRRKGDVKNGTKKKRLLSQSWVMVPSVCTWQLVELSSLKNCHFLADPVASTNSNSNFNPTAICFHFWNFWISLEKTNELQKLQNFADPILTFCWKFRTVWFTGPMVERILSSDSKEWG